MANVVRWDPFGEMLTLREAINSIFDESVVRPNAARGQNVTMPLNVAETKDGFVIEAVIPGVTAEDLDISIQDNVLTITGETRQEKTTDSEPHYHRIERRYGRVSRSISLPTQVQSNAVQATLNNGILRLELPKMEAVKPRKITVQPLAANGQTQKLDVSHETVPENN